MPSTPLKNVLYRTALPFFAPNPRKQMEHEVTGRPLAHLSSYERMLVKHRVLGASLLLSDGKDTAQVYTTVYDPRHAANENTMFRVASITKIATALVTLMCVDEELFTLDTPIRPLLPETAHGYVLDGMTVRQLLCHTSGLRDIPSVGKALREGNTFDSVVATGGIAKFVTPMCRTPMIYDKDLLLKGLAVLYRENARD